MSSAMASERKYFANPGPGHSQYTKYVFETIFLYPLQISRSFIKRKGSWAWLVLTLTCV